MVRVWGNLTWRKQEYFVEHVLGVPISQGSCQNASVVPGELGAKLSTVASLQQPGVGVWMKLPTASMALNIGCG